MIDIKNITKSFGSLQVLKGIDLHVDKGEVVSIVGPSGAGKTTLLQIMGTLDRPDNGQIVIDGTDVHELKGKALSRFRNEKIGFVFQFHQLLPEFTALENIMIPAFSRSLIVVFLIPTISAHSVTVFVSPFQVKRRLLRLLFCCSFMVDHLQLSGLYPHSFLMRSIVSLSE